MDNHAPKWLKTAIITGLQRLMVQRLKGAPAAETSTLVAQVWIDAMMHTGRDWQQQLDESRLQAAFAALSRDMTEWPQPRQLLDRLPARKIEQPRLPEPEVDPERVKQFKKRLREVLAK